MCEGNLATPTYIKLKLMQLMHKCGGFVAMAYITSHTYSFAMYCHDQIMNSLLQHLHKFANTNNKKCF